MGLLLKALELCFVPSTVYGYLTTHIDTLTCRYLLCDGVCVISVIKTGIKESGLASANFTKESRSFWQMAAIGTIVSYKVTVAQYTLTL